eukprot:TRINITY_DN79958_c0_g1_i1.p1 TRINITY_DN79958_c0_g1~~TRINITY_DN79958_c0_g1_i1.p1  ORF type:complete len:135 (-),score=6.00 TRINITY_DN79958_c0_g1_i1:457-861(-)
MNRFLSLVFVNCCLMMASATVTTTKKEWAKEEWTKEDEQATTTRAAQFKSFNTYLPPSCNTGSVVNSETGCISPWCAFVKNHPVGCKCNKDDNCDAGLKCGVDYQCRSGAYQRGFGMVPILLLAVSFAVNYLLA